jgi:hypothetical protein
VPCWDTRQARGSFTADGCHARGQTPDAMGHSDQTSAPRARCVVCASPTQAVRPEGEGGCVLTRCPVAREKI